MSDRKAYPSDLSDGAWARLEPLLPVQKTGRPRLYPQREMLNAIFYLLRTGCSWRSLPHDLPPWEAVYAYFRKLSASGVWVQINDRLREQARVKEGREADPSTIIVDSQSVKTTEKGGLVATTATNGSKDASARLPWTVAVRSSVP
ncbi:MAG TPA: IS5 family transposase [Aggregatilineaceae bacterium]|nr:IS5 family transposase [Aggregatilineaceae bacterium]